MKLVSLVALALLFALGPASAHTGSDAPLRFSLSETGDTYWTENCTGADWGCPAVGSSPLDAGNAWAVYAAQGEDYDAMDLYNGTSGIKGQRVADVKNLSFDWSGVVDQERSPRILVNFTNGGYAMLTHAYCSKVISSYPDDRWLRSDFTGQRAVNGRSCGIWMHSYTGVWDFYSATPTRSAWDSLARAKPGLVVKNAYWTLDGTWEGFPESPPGASEHGEIYTVLVDRLAIQNHMWVAPRAAGVRHCSTESSC